MGVAVDVASQVVGVVVVAVLGRVRVVVHAVRVVQQLGPVVLDVLAVLPGVQVVERDRTATCEAEAGAELEGSSRTRNRMEVAYVLCSSACSLFPYKMPSVVLFFQLKNEHAYSELLAIEACAVFIVPLTVCVL